MPDLDKLTEDLPDITAQSMGSSALYQGPQIYDPALGSLILDPRNHDKLMTLLDAKGVPPPPDAKPGISHRDAAQGLGNALSQQPPQVDTMEAMSPRPMPPAAGLEGGTPPYPASVPPGASWNPRLAIWELPNGYQFDRTGNPLDSAGIDRETGAPSPEAPSAAPSGAPASPGLLQRYMDAMSGSLGTTPPPIREAVPAAARGYYNAMAGSLGDTPLPPPSRPSPPFTDADTGETSTLGPVPGSGPMPYHRSSQDYVPTPSSEAPTTGAAPPPSLGEKPGDLSVREPTKATHPDKTVDGLSKALAGLSAMSPKVQTVHSPAPYHATGQITRSNLPQALLADILGAAKPSSTFRLGEALKGKAFA